MFDATGRLVTELVDRDYLNGARQLIWEDQQGHRGLFFYRIYFNDIRVHAGRVVKQ